MPCFWSFRTFYYGTGNICTGIIPDGSLLPRNVTNLGTVRSIFEAVKLFLPLQFPLFKAKCVSDHNEMQSDISSIDMSLSKSRCTTSKV